MSEAAANAGDRAESEVEWLAAVDIGGEHTEHITESRRIGHLERHEFERPYKTDQTDNFTIVVTFGEEKRKLEDSSRRCKRMPVKENT